MKSSPERGRAADTHSPTVGEILRLPELRRGRPTVEAGRNALTRPVRWVHVSEVPDIAYLLQGGELILTTGVALPQLDDGLSRYVSDLAGAHAAGLVIELGRRFASLPPPLIQSAESHNLPLIALHAEVAFVAVTEAIHSIIVNNQVRQLRLGEEVHRSFRSMATEALTPLDIVGRVAKMAGRPTIFENDARHVLVYAGTESNNTDFLENWEDRSREAGALGPTVLMDDEHWFSVAVSARGHQWGRLVLLSDEPATTLQRTIMELGATNLALHLLIERDERVLEHQTHRTLIADIIGGSYISVDEIHTRSKSLGVVTKRQTLTGLVIGTPWDASLSDIARHLRAREELTAVSRALRDTSASGLVGLLEPGRLGVLLSTPSETLTEPMINACAKAIRERTGRLYVGESVVIGVGSSVNLIDDVPKSFSEATEAADAARDLPGDHLFVTTKDIRLRGLVHLLRDDRRIQNFYRRELGALVDHDARCGTTLLATLSALLDTGGNKSAAAESIYMNRATFYHRLTRIEGILGCDLSSSECRYSLYVALLIYKSSRR